MWVLVVIQLMAGSATGRSSLPSLHSGVAMQEFSSHETCEQAVKEIRTLSAKTNQESQYLTVHDGIISMRCIKK